MVCNIIKGIYNHLKGLKYFVELNQGKEGISCLLEPHLTGLMTKTKELESIESFLACLKKEVHSIEKNLNNIVAGVASIQSFCEIFEDANISTKLNGVGNLIKSQLEVIEKSHSLIEDSCLEIDNVFNIKLLKNV